MDIQDNETITIDDDDDLEDPIRLWDLEKLRVFFGYRFINARPNILSDHAEQLKELVTQSHGTFKQSENLTCSNNLNIPKCRPCFVKMVDICKFPQWSGHKYKIKNLKDKPKEDIIFDDVKETNERVSCSNEGVECKINESKNKVDVKTSERIVFNDNNNFVHEKVSDENSTLDLKAKQTKTLSTEIEESSVYNSNIIGAVENINNHTRRCLSCHGSVMINNPTKSEYLCQTYKNKTQKLESGKIDDCWTNPKLQTPLNNNMMMKKQLKNTARTSTVSDPESIKMIGETVLGYHQNSPCKSFECQERYCSSHRIIPHYHKRLPQNIQQSRSKTAKEAKKPYDCKRVKKMYVKFW